MFNVKEAAVLHKLHGPFKQLIGEGAQSWPPTDLIIFF